MKIKTSELTGAALDWAVAKCEEPSGRDNAASWQQDFKIGFGTRYSSNWSQGGPIIEREVGTLWSTNANGWVCKAKYDYANEKEGPTACGPTPLIAAMRCYVASKLGDEVEIPEELLK